MLRLLKPSSVTNEWWTWLDNTGHIKLHQMLETLSIQNPKEEKNMVETISREDSAWLAAIIEGEGSIFIAKHKLSHGKISYRLAITVTNTDYRLLQKVSYIWFKLGCKFYYKLKKTTNGYAMSIESIGRGSTNKIMRCIYPFIISKKDQVELAMAFNDKMDEIFYNRMPVDEYVKIQHKYVDTLQALHHHSINPQRLKRVASQPLEMMV